MLTKRQKRFFIRNSKRRAQNPSKIAQKNRFKFEANRRQYTTGKVIQRLVNTVM